jgi:hypothetical protein
VAVQVESLPAYDALAQVFWYDWLASGGTLPPPTVVYMPLVVHQYAAPTPPPPPPPTSSAWLSHVNSFRALVNLPDVTECHVGDGDWKHSLHGEEQLCRAQQDPVPGTLRRASGGSKRECLRQQQHCYHRHGRDRLVDERTLHAVAVLDPALQQVGYGYREADGGWQMGATLDVAAVRARFQPPSPSRSPIPAMAR